MKGNSGLDKARKWREPSPKRLIFEHWGVYKLTGMTKRQCPRMPGTTGKGRMNSLRVPSLANTHVREQNSSGPQGCLVEGQAQPAVDIFSILHPEK